MTTPREGVVPSVSPATVPEGGVGRSVTDEGTARLQEELRAARSKLAHTEAQLTGRPQGMRGCLKKVGLEGGDWVK